MAATSSAASLANGQYDRVAAAYYRTAAELTHGTRCEKLSHWYAKRDLEISSNIASEVLRNPGRRIVVVTGCDHHGPVVTSISGLGASVVLVPVKDNHPASMLPR
jgi:hypothetical protein